MATAGMQLLVPGSDGDVVDDVGRAYAILLLGTQTSTKELQTIVHDSLPVWPVANIHDTIRTIHKHNERGERGRDGDAVDDVSDDGVSDWRL